MGKRDSTTPSKDKKEKREKKEKKEKKAVKETTDNEGMQEVADIEAGKVATSPIANPLASERLEKKVLKLVNKGKIHVPWE